MYKSPIELLTTDIQYQIEKQQDEEIYKAVLHYIPNIDKEELIKALRYDRNQYDKGYADGKADAMADLVRCKDCQHYSCGFCMHSQWWNEDDATTVESDDFCSYGERKDND